MGKKNLIKYALVSTIGFGSAVPASAGMLDGVTAGLKNLFTFKKAAPKAAQEAAPDLAESAKRVGPDQSISAIMRYRDDLQGATSGLFRDIRDRVQSGHYFNTYGRETVVDEVMTLLNSLGRDIMAITGGPGVGKSQVLISLQERILKGEVPQALQNAHVVEVNAGNNMLSELQEFKSQLDVLVQTLNSKAGDEGMVIIAFSDIGRFLTEDAVKAQAFDSIVQLVQHKFGSRPVKFVVEGTEANVQKLAAGYSSARGLPSVKLPALSTYHATAIAKEMSEYLKRENNYNLSEEEAYRAVQLAEQHLGLIGMPKSVVMLVLGAKSLRETLTKAVESPLSKHLRDLNKDLELQYERLKGLDGAHAARELKTLPGKIAENNEKIIEIEKRFRELKAAVAELKLKEQELLNLGNKRVPAELEAKVKELQAKINQVTEDEMTLWIARETGASVDQIIQKAMSLDEFKEVLDKGLIGQDEAKAAMMRVAEAARGVYRTDTAPVRSVLLVGYPGTGKTEAVKLVARFLSNNLVRFDMSEFVHSHQMSRLIGAPPGYVGFDKLEVGELVRPLVAKKEGALLFDEINLAHKDVQNIQYQLASDGRITSSSGVEGSATGWGLFGTTNLGMERLKPGMTRDEKVKILIEEGMNPAILDRFDEIVVMNRLDGNSFGQIAAKGIRLLHEEMAKISYRGLEVTEAAINELVRPIIQGQVTAREVNRIIKNKVTAVINQARRGTWRDANGGTHEINFKEGDLIRMDYEMATGGMRLDIVPASQAHAPMPVAPTSPNVQQLQENLRNLNVQ